MTTDEKCREIILKIRDMCNTEEAAYKQPMISFSQDWGGDSLTVEIAGQGHSHIGDMSGEGTFDGLIDDLYNMLIHSRGLSFVQPVHKEPTP